MGQRTRLQVVTNGLLMAGNGGSLATVANGWLNTWLETTLDSWPWPWLVKRQSAVPLAQGAASVLFGMAATGTPAGSVRRVLDPVMLYNSGYSALGRVRVRQIYGGTLDEDETINNPVSVGQPQTFKVRASDTSIGQWSLIPWPIPDRAYLLAVDYVGGFTFIDETTAGDAVKPPYPADRTMEYAVCCEALKYMKRWEDYNAFAEALASMVITDRMRYGQADGTNDTIGLDESVFPPAGRRSMWLP